MRSSRSDAAALFIMILLAGAAAAQPPGSSLGNGAPTRPIGSPPPVSNAGELKALNPQPLPPDKLGITPAAGTQFDAKGGAANLKALNPQPLPPDKLGLSPGAGAKLNVGGNTSAAAGIPHDLFKLEDRAIIIVGGKPVQAGAVKQELRNELKRLSGPPKVTRLPSRTARPINGSSPAGRAKAGPAMQPNLSRPVPSVELRAGVATGATLGTANPRPLLPAADIVRDRGQRIPNCKSDPPEILQVQGQITPGGKFTLVGLCLGDQVGRVEMIGQFPGGNLRLTFSEWNANRIVAAVPDVRGAIDHATAITVVRSGDQKRSAAMQSAFVAKRERVVVPDHHWAPRNQISEVEVTTSESTPFNGKMIVTGSSPPLPQVTSNYQVTVSPACALDSMEANASLGGVLAIHGWDDAGPPNVGNVRITWSPRCITQTYNFLASASQQRVCSVQVELRTWANCPVGIAP